MSRTRVILETLAKTPAVTLREIATASRIDEDDARVTVAQLVRERRVSGEIVGPGNTKVYSLSALGRAALETPRYVKGRDVFERGRPPNDGRRINARTVARKVANSVFQLGEKS